MTVSAHLLDFFLDRRRHGTVADVGVDFHQKITTDDHRFGLRVIDVRRDDRAAASDFIAHEFRCYLDWDLRSE
jgi:hypothetical protein